MLPVYLPKTERKQKKAYENTHTHAQTHIHRYERANIDFRVFVVFTLGSDLNV